MTEVRLPRINEPELSYQEVMALLHSCQADSSHTEYQESIEHQNLSAHVHDGYDVGTCIHCKRPIIRGRSQAVKTCGRPQCR